MAKQIKQKKPSNKELSNDSKTCFIISTIGQEGTDVHKKFKDVLEYIIKPAVDTSGYKLEIIRADDIEKAGSFIVDILNNIVDSFVVIADLTGQNPNVFYELGVRHSFSPRTILIAQSLDDIPSDLREYRTIIYDDSAKGLALFKTKLHKYLKEIFDKPERSDNPVLDRVGGLLENQKQRYLEEISSLKEQLTNVLKGTISNETIAQDEKVESRVNRILKLVNAQRQSLSGSFSRTSSGGIKKNYTIPASQGRFSLYFLLNGETILDNWYLSITENNINLERELSDVRVLMENCSKEQDVEIKFIIATNDDLSGKKESIQKAFNKMKNFIPTNFRKYFTLLIWDKIGLTQEEEKNGLKIVL